MLNTLNIFCLFCLIYVVKQFHKYVETTVDARYSLAICCMSQSHVTITASVSPLICDSHYDFKDRRRLSSYPSQLWTLFFLPVTDTIPKYLHIYLAFTVASTSVLVKLVYKYIANEAVIGWCDKENSEKNHPALHIKVHMSGPWRVLRSRGETCVPLW